MILLFSDNRLHHPVSGKILEENRTYYIKLRHHDASRIKAEIESNRLSQLYEWHPENPIGKICFKNIVGTVKIFGERFDIRSTKFLPSESGDSQYRILLKALSELSQKIIFENVSKSTSAFDHGQRATGNIFFKFNYLKSLFLEYPRQQKAEYLFQLITHNPHTKQDRRNRSININRLKKFSSRTIQKFITQPQHLQRLPEGHPYAQCNLGKFLSRAIPDQAVFPVKAYTSAPEPSLDTNENRFVKFFFEDTILLSAYIKNNYKQYPHLPKLAEKMICQSGKILRHTFFNSITIPSTAACSGSSTILNNRSGYKELYQHYLRSRLSPRSFFDYIQNHVKFLDVKNIATLYEYWVFLYLCKKLIPKELTFKYIRDIIENNRIKPSGTIRSENLVISYNRTFSNTSRQSYALNFRPDITIEFKGKTINKKIILDAKYKNRPLSFNSEYKENSAVVYKNEDIAKMLSYSESIRNVEGAFIVYPGDQFVFYQKKYTKNNIMTDINSMTAFTGVGAIPLSPGNRNSINIFDKFVGKLKSYLFS